MSEVLSASDLGQVADLDASSTTSRGHTPQGDHEVVDTTQVELPSDAGSTAESVHDDESTGAKGENAVSPIAPSLVEENTPEPTAEAEVKPKPLATKPVASKVKPTMSVKPPTGKQNGGPTTPLVKRVRCDASYIYLQIDILFISRS